MEKTIACDKCGKCCKTLVVSDSCDEETISMKKGYKGKLKYKGDTYYVLDVPCVYLSEITLTCSIYKDRPEMCRKFPGPYSDFWKNINPKCSMLEGEQKRL